MLNFKNTIPDKLDPRVMTVALVVAVVEFEVFTYAKGVVKIAGRDAWICSLIGGLLTAVLTFLLVKLASRFPKESFFQYNRRVWGKFIAFMLGVSYLIYWFLYLVLLFEDSNEANKLFFLRETPSIVPLAIFAIAASLLAIYGITALIRFFQITFPFLLIPLAAIFLLSIAEIDITTFLPVLSNGLIPVLKGSVYYVGGLQGIEIVLFVSPFLTNVGKSVKPVLSGFFIIWLIVLFEVTSSIGLLGIETIKSSLYPGFDAITVIELPGFPVQRFELFLTISWLIGVFTTICLVVYLLSYGIIEIFHLKNKKLICYSVSVLAVAAAYLFPSVAVEQKIRSSFNIATLIFVFVIPILTLLLATLRKMRGCYNE